MHTKRLREQGFRPLEEVFALIKSRNEVADVTVAEPMEEEESSGSEETEDNADRGAEMIEGSHTEQAGFALVRGLLNHFVSQ